MSLLTMNHLGPLLLSLPAFGLLALAMIRHQEDLLGRALSPRQSRVLRGIGWLLLSLALALAIDAQGLALGLVSWAGHLSLAAGLVFLGLLILQRRSQRR